MSESDWGEDTPDLPPPPPPEESRAPAAVGVPAGLDVAGAAVEAVDSAVKGAVRKEVAAIATQAVEDALTEELVERLREQAQASAAAAVKEQLSPAEPDPEPEPPAEEEEKAPELVYGSVDEFLREYLRHVYSRRIDGKERIWAARWWEYTEAVIRLEALWRAWEHLRLDPSTGMSVWWRDHADHHMSMLMDPKGAFIAARSMDAENQCAKGEPLPYAAPPAGLFPDVRKQQESAGRSSRPEPPAEPDFPPPPPPPPEE